ncbi:MAG: SirB2 family protein [Gammaproteobacteria bacterium]|nr:SirB2 family protein [Gammaproteobacteria bacterium]
MLKTMHVILAYATVIGFILRAFWSLSANEASRALVKRKAARILPHIIDTALLAIGVALAVMAQISLVEGWLAAKLAGLAAYIGFGVLTLRGRSTALKSVGLFGALLSVGYVFAVAFTRQVVPW